MKTIKRYWLFFVLILILFPALINAIHSQINEPSGWTSVWAEYGGAIISTLAAFFILYEQQKQNHDENEQNRKLQSDAIQQNHEENERNRKLQIEANKQNHIENERNRKLQLNTIKYQQEYAKFTEFKSKLISLYSNLSPLYIMREIQAISNIYNTPFTNLPNDNIFKEEIENMKKEFDCKMDKINTNRIHVDTFYCNINKDELNQAEETSYNLIIDYVDSYVTLIGDLLWILTKLPNYNNGYNKDENYIRYVIAQEEEFNKQFIKEKPKSKDIINIIKKFDYKFYDNALNIIGIRANILLEGEIKKEAFMQPAMYTLIKYEQQKVNDILTKDIN